MDTAALCRQEAAIRARDMDTFTRKHQMSVTKRIPASCAGKIHSSRHICGKKCQNDKFHTLPWADHAIWLTDAMGKTCVLGQPYGLTPAQRTDLQDWCYQRGLVWQEMGQGPHNPGTIAILVRPRDGFEALRSGSPRRTVAELVEMLDLSDVPR